MKPLTDRQLAALRLKANGLTYTEIAAQLDISGPVAAQEILAAGDALGARNTTHAVAIAFRTGLFNSTDVTT